MLLFIRSGMGWWRRRLAWSNSRESWQERVGVAAVIGAAAAIWWLSDRLSFAQEALLWVLLVAALAILLRRGWLKLFGPVLFYDLVRTARRGRYFLIRGLYAGALCLLLFWQFLEYVVTSEQQQSSRQIANFAESFFYGFMYIQFLAVLFLTPALTAGAVAEEKERRTLEFLLATDLRNREIVLSKLAARTGNLILVVLTGLPILSFTQFLGGIDPGLMLAGFAVTLLTALSLGAFGMLNSVLLKRPRDAIILTYLGVIVYNGLAFLLFGLAQGFPQFAQFPSTGEWDSPATVGDVADWLNAGNLLLALGKLSEAVDAGQSIADTLPELLRNYAIFHGLVTLICAGWAVLRLRALALRQLFGQARRSSFRWWHRLRPPVGSQPMLWKELLVEGGMRFHWFGKLLVLLLVVGSFATLALFLELSSWMSSEAAFNVWVRLVGTIVACLMLLGVAVRAAGGITGERDRQTLDGLLTTPLTAESIFFSKWLGSILGVRWSWLWLGLIAGTALVGGGLDPMAVPLLMGAWVVYAGFLAGLGMWFSVSARGTMRATLWTIGTALTLSLGHWLIWMCCGPLMALDSSFGRAFDEAPMRVAEFQGLALTPPATLSFLAFQGKEFDNFLDKEAALALAFCLVGMGIYGVGAAVLYGLGNERLRQQTRRRREGLPHLPADERWTQPILSAEPAEDPAAPPNPPES